MSNLVFGPLPGPASPLDANEINDAYEAVQSALGEIRDENIEPGSVFNRHIVSGEIPGTLAGAPFKEITHVSLTTNWDTGPALGADVCLIGNTGIVQPDEIDCRGVFAVVAMATIPCRVHDITLPVAPRIPGTVFVDASIRVRVPGLKSICGAQAITGTEPGAVLEDEMFNLQMVGAFAPTDDTHEVSLWLNAGTTENLELNSVGSVGNPSLIVWTLRS